MVPSLKKLAALDSRNNYAHLGTSRAASMGALSEPITVLIFIMFGVISKTHNPYVINNVFQSSISWYYSLTHWFTAFAFFMVLLIEIGSFVSDKAVPAMSNTDELIKKLGNLDNYSVLIPNKKGLDKAKDNGVKEICTVLCVTDSMNKKNINQTVHETLNDLREIFTEGLKNGIRTKCYVSVAYHCPYEGKVDAVYVNDVIGQLIDYQVDELVIADTIGAANPKEVNSLLSSLKSQYKDTNFSCHFHDTRALGLANVYASLVAGINKFDSCIGGLGGCPFAPKSSGNLATEDLVSMLEMMNITTGVNLDKLIESRELASEYTSLSLKGRMI
jgi:hydroxymethylglutaryl-CoA lyase